ncbi:MULTISPECIES: hypothetical protein [unclassified Microbacterium]|uniref:hypothetical protein n=1 Tax=unclassified Microbacterium TaxID=2609290 RepID=UPI00109D719A|nr:MULTISPECIES: hypothetical protein [unclassified Microbacterium]
MSDRFLVNAVGAVIEIDASQRDEDFRARALAAWVDALHNGDRVADAVAVVPADTEDAAALSALSTDVTMKALAHRRHDPVWMLHAAGLATDDGRVVVLSAASGTGKTTAARHLSQRYAYVSDETIGIDDSGRIVPYRKPLSIIEQAAVPKAQLALSSIGGSHPLPDELRVAKIVVIDRSPEGPEEPEVEPLDIADALALLGPQTSYLSDGPAPLQRIAALLAATGGAVRLRYREVSGIDGIIDDLLDVEPAPVPPIATGVVPAADMSAADTSAPDAYRRAETVDELVLDQRVVVLRRTPTGGQVQVLDGIGPTIWTATAGGSTLAQIVDAVVAAHGEPADGDPASIVQTAVQVLVDDGLLLPPQTPSGPQT